MICLVCTHSRSQKLGVADLPTETGLKQALETVVTVLPLPTVDIQVPHRWKGRFIAIETSRLKDNPGNIAQSCSFCGVHYSMLQKPGCNNSDEFLVPAHNSVEKDSTSMTLDTRKKSVTYKVVIMTVIKKLEYTQSNSFYF